MKGGGVHIGSILGWVTTVVAGASLATGAVAGGNAFVDATEASKLLREARRNGYHQIFMNPVITEVHARAVTYSMVANVFFIVGGAAALGAAGFFLWAGLSKAPAKPARAALPPRSNPIHIVSVQSWE